MNKCAWLSTQQKYYIPDSVKQIIIVNATRGSYATLLACDKVKGEWQENKLGSVNAILGVNGVAEFGEKREGDGKTPSGIYSFGLAFGHAKIDGIKLPYHVLTAYDKFVDDVQSPEYNTWVSGSSAAKSYENMLKIGEPYRLGVVINYNMNPIIPGLGSAIFMHVWTDKEDGTAGCVALKYHTLVKIMKWLDITKNPRIVITT